MARPKKDITATRTEQLNVRFTPVERLQLAQLAHDAGMTSSEYIRAQALTGRVIIHQNRSLDHAALDQLRRIGVNLNQLARIANQTDKIPGRLTDTLATLERLLEHEITGKAPAPHAKDDFAPASKSQPQTSPETAPGAKNQPHNPAPRHEP